MYIPLDWFENIYKLVRENKHYYRHFLPKEISDMDLHDLVMDDIQTFLNIPMNLSWDIPRKQADRFKEFFIKIVYHQICRNVYPIYCFLDKDHMKQQPRITEGGDLYTICPTCGHITIMEE